MKDKRRQPRHPVILKVDYRDVNKFFTDFAENLSAGGMFIATRKPLPPGSTIVVEFMLPDTSLKVRTRAEVMWARKDASSTGEKRGMGVRFSDLSSEDKKKIDLLVSRLREGVI
ncbi:MAG: TIGR02266 family protein [Thermodesulfobacteria bacterium]|nr:TIGR02266 family protein [Thermodesulfobacteriota bacterium]